MLLWHLRGGFVGRNASPSFLLEAVHCLLTWCAPGGSPHPMHSFLLAATAPHRLPPVLRNLISPLGSCWAVTGGLSSALMFLPNATGGREMISPLTALAGSPGRGKDRVGDVLPAAPGCLLLIFPCSAVGNGSSMAVMWRGWSHLPPYLLPLFVTPQVFVVPSVLPQKCTLQRTIFKNTLPCLLFFHWF